MKKYSATMVLFVLITAGCNGAATNVEVPEDWASVNAKDAFTFRAPPDLVEQHVQGIDSLVGKYDSPTLELSYDYGMYSDPLEGESYRSWTFRNVTVDGRRARIGHSESRMAIHFPQVGTDSKLGDIKLSMSATLKQPAAKDAAEIIFRSVDFP
jgi:hypothetical protein